VSEAFVVLKVHDLMEERGIALDVIAADKRDVIAHAASLLGAIGATKDVEAIEAAFAKRESVMSTGIGGGIAIPHAQSAAVERMAVLILRLAEPVDFDAIDRLPVRLVVAIAGPEERGGFVRVLARISRLLSDPEFRDRLMTAERPEEVLQAIARKEEASRV
jgi:PTS system fructose-specific IIC component